MQQRMGELGIGGYRQYLEYVDSHPGELEAIDGLTPITISRFFRDRACWDALERDHLPGLLQRALEQDRPFRVWSAGCASGEEPYSMAILWQHSIRPQYPEARIEILATDRQQHMLQRAYEACYGRGSLKEMNQALIGEAFEKQGSFYCLKPEYREMVSFLQQDIRREMPGGMFDVVFCKNIVAMYLEKTAAAEIFNRISRRMQPGAVLLLGNHEPFPCNLPSHIITL